MSFWDSEQLLWTLPSTKYSVCLNDACFAVAQIMVCAPISGIRTSFCEQNLWNPITDSWRAYRGKKNKNIVFHNFGWWTSKSDSWRHPVSVDCDMEGREWTGRGGRLAFSFQRARWKGGGRGPGFFLYLFSWWPLFAGTSCRFGKELWLAVHFHMCPCHYSTDPNLHSDKAWSNWTDWLNNWVHMICK